MIASRFAPTFASSFFVFFFMRELECATAEYADLRIQESSRIIVLNMSVSKNDPRAIGCERKWGCVCIGEPSERTCPYHAALELTRFLKDRFGKKVFEPGFPLFPNSFGEPVPGETMLEMIVTIAKLLDEPLYNKAGQFRIGKHTWRAMAAILMGEVGLDIFKIRMMGRWNCSVVIHYTRDAPISDMASDYIHAKKSREDAKQPIKKDIALKKIRSVVETTLGEMKAELHTLNDKICKIERKAAPDYVINRNTKKIHRILSSYADAGSEAIAVCGFAYARPGALTRFDSVIPHDAKWEDICSTCLPEVRARLKVLAGPVP